MQYRDKILLSLLFVALVPTLISGILFYQTSAGRLVQSLENSRKAQLHLVARELDDQMEIYRHVSESIAVNRQFLDALPDADRNIYHAAQSYDDVVDPLFELNMYNHPEIRQLTVYLEGIGYEHAHTVAPLDSLQQMDWYSRNAADEPRECWIASIEDGMIYYVRPVMYFTDFKGVLVLSFDGPEFFSALPASLAAKGEGICATTADGTVLYTDGSEWITGESARIPEDKEGRWLEEQLSENGWQLAYWIPQSAVYGALNETVVTYTAMLAICLVFILIASIPLSRVLVSRVVRLTGEVGRIGEDTESLSIEPYNGPMDEVGHLIRGVDEMVHRLHELKIAVYREKIAHRDLEMKALQAQINPHFLYNSLSIINWKAIEAGADEVSGITLMLAEFYRTTLNRGSGIITVDGEVRNIRSYLNIQLVMHDNEFRVEWEVDSAALSWTMPKLVLQPLVENALEHGLDLKEDPDKLLAVGVGVDEDDLVLTVRDNGVGMPQEKADTLIHYDAKGYGVKNVKERIALLYGEHHTFRITSRENEGTEIYIRIPKERRAQT